MSEEESKEEIHSFFLKNEIFKKFKSIDDEQLSLHDIIQYNKRELKELIFIFDLKLKRENKIYLRIKINEIKVDNDDEIMISIIDASHEILRNS